MKRASVVPAILAHSEREFRAGVRALGGRPQVLHLDVGDGKFVATKTWADPATIRRLRIPNLEVHLMVQHLERVVGEWVKAGARRVIMHAEAKGSRVTLRQAQGDKKVNVGLAINPETPVARVRPFLKFVDFILVMSVVPGAQGRPFDRRAIAKIKALKRLRPELVVAVDGGLNKRTIPAVLRAGADRLVVGSAIIHSKNPVQSFKKLQEVCQTFIQKK